MKKNIGIVIFVLVVLVGGWYMMSANKNMESPANNENEQVVVNESATTGEKVLVVVGAESKATYEINEDLKGKRTHVTGTSQALTGTISLDSVTNKIIGGEVKLDAASFKTDIAARDGNVKTLVLKADQPGNESIMFTATSVTGLPDIMEMDKDFAVKVMGNMTISGVTKPVSFDGMAKLAADGTARIKASTVLAYADFGVAIPDFPFLANIDKTVKLTVELIAR